MYHAVCMLDRDYVVRALQEAARRCCCYLKRPCDCKYGIGDDAGLNGSGEQNGCPELMSLAETVATISKLDWSRLSQKAGHFHANGLKMNVKTPAVQPRRSHKRKL